MDRRAEVKGPPQMLLQCVLAHVERHVLYPDCLLNNVSLVGNNNCVNPTKAYQVANKWLY